MKIMLFLAVLLASFSAHSAFYKCVTNGKVTLTDKPCDEGSKSEELKNIHVSPSPISVARQAQQKGGSSSSVERMNKATSSLFTDRRKKEINREILGKRERVSYLQKMMDLEVARLRTKKRYANNNLAGATWEESISEEISAVVARYDSKIAVTQRDIDRLYKDLDEL